MQKNKAHAHHIHQVTIGIKLNNEDKLEELLYNISTPGHNDYGNHFTKGQLDGYLSNPNALLRVKTYLQSYPDVTILNEPAIRTDQTQRQQGIMQIMKVQASIATWEEILATSFFEFHPVQSSIAKTKHMASSSNHHLRSNNRFSKPLYRAHNYSLPFGLHDHVSYVLDAIDFPVMNTIHPILTPVDTNHSSFAPINYVTPSLLFRVYGIPSTTQGSSSTTQAAYASLGEYFSPTDLSLFQQQQGLPIQPIAQDIGGHVRDDACTFTPTVNEHCTELSVDIQYMTAMGRGVPTILYYVESGDLLSFLQEVNGLANAPKVIGISYGGLEDQYTASYVSAFNTQAMQLGLKGTTLVASSGDDGVGGWRARANRHDCGYHPLFPASSPYVLAVSGTQGPENGQPDRAAQANRGVSFTAGGGFSLFSSTPAYQSDAVNAYFNAVQGSNDQSPVPGYNRNGRGYPDVAIVGVNYYTILGGVAYALGGTSTTTPTIAGLLSLVNSGRIAQGRSTLGFVNPLLYSQAANLMKQVPSGGNNKCTTQGFCCREGFFVVGTTWNPVVGLGVPEFQNLYSIAMSV